jgi:hypothetical protein
MNKILENQKQKEINLKEKQITQENNYLDMDDESIKMNYIKYLIIKKQ